MLHLGDENLEDQIAAPQAAVRGDSLVQGVDEARVGGDEAERQSGQ